MVRFIWKMLGYKYLLATSVWTRQTYSSILKPRIQYVLHTYSFVCAVSIFKQCYLSPDRIYVILVSSNKFFEPRCTYFVVAIARRRTTTSYLMSSLTVLSNSSQQVRRKTSFALIILLFCWLCFIEKFCGALQPFFLFSTLL